MISVSQFQKLILSWYAKNGRHTLPWRTNVNSYRILVSEIMLQQTQVDRVIFYYRRFLKMFPSVRSLANADAGAVIRAWQGLGYNRRALFLKKTAEAIMRDFHGRFPKEREALESLPGIGPYTARAVSVYAFNSPEVFIETNIRRVYLHYFFPRRTKVTDAELLPVVEKTLWKENPREWYSALMDYGAVELKKIPNPNIRSRHYVRQATFEGSNRQIRGRILKFVSAHRGLALSRLNKEIPDPRLKENLGALIREGFLKKKGSTLSLR